MTTNAKRLNISENDVEAMIESYLEEHATTTPQKGDITKDNLIARGLTESKARELYEQIAKSGKVTALKYRKDNGRLAGLLRVKR